MKKVIEKIEKIKGVEKVTETGCNELTVQVEKRKVAVKCTNEEQFNFIFIEMSGSNPKQFSFMDDAGDGGCYDTVAITDSDGNPSSQSEHCVKNRHGHTIMPFSQYLSDYNLKDEWKKYLIGEAEKRYPVGTKFAQLEYCAKRTVRKSSHYYASKEDAICCGSTPREEWDSPNFPSNPYIYLNGKWATIIEPELELISGEIYESTSTAGKRLVRYKSTNKGRSFVLYSQIEITGDRKGKYWDDSRFYHGSIDDPATNKQKAKLIKAELKNGYLWNGKDLIKYK